MKLEPVAWVKFLSHKSPDTPDGPGEWDDDTELYLDGELASYEGYTPLYAIPSGYKVVPVEPTEVMMKAAHDVYEATQGQASTQQIYKAMIAAIEGEQ